MRRITSSALIGLGAFLIVAAVLVRFYAYPSIAVTPTNYSSDTSLEVKGATIFDAATLAPITVDLSINSYTIADSSADAPDGFTVWVNRSSITRDDIEGATCDASVDPAKPGCFQQASDRAPLDSDTGAAASEDQCPGCGSTSDESFIDGDQYSTRSVDVPREGQVYKMPFNTQKKDIEWWDSSIRQATTMEYIGEENVNGLDTYKFVQVIDPTDIGDQDLPGSVFGVADATVTADLVYAMTRTLWIEPVTGSPVMRTEVRNQVFEYDDIQVPAFVGTIRYTDDQVDEFVSDGKSQGFLLGGMRLLFPVSGLLLGLLAIAGGIVLSRGGKRPEHQATDDRTLISA